MRALIEYLMSLCECCDDECDCGCLEECPRHKPTDPSLDHADGGPDA